MPEDKTPDPKQDPSKEPSPEEQETKFWSTFETKLDSWFDKRVAKMREEAGTGTTRMGGRTSLPTIIFDALFGQSKKD